jgi:hypothetical protein
MVVLHEKLQDTCNNRTISCGLSVCYAPQLLNYTVSTSAVDPSVPVIIDLVFNQSIWIKSKASAALLQPTQGTCFSCGFVCAISFFTFVKHNF